MDDLTLKNDVDLIEIFLKSGGEKALQDSLARVTTQYAQNADALKAFAVVLNRNDRFEEALRIALQGLRIDPLHPLLHHNAARALSITGRTAQSRPHSEQAARLRPDNPYLQYHFAGVQLCLGEFEEGWKRHSWYYQIPGKREELVYPPFPEWKGQPLAGTTFLLAGEQGRGDEIQLIRFAKWLAEQGAIVDALVSAPVASLATSMKDIRNVYTVIPPGPYTYWCHMFRIPEFMKLDFSILPIATSYLSAPQAKVDYWRDRIDALSPAANLPPKKKRIGVVWAGGSSSALDRFRSVRLDQFKSLFALPGTTWFALQKGALEGESQALEHEFDLHTLGPEIGDFTDTLAILHSLDLVVTVDTSVAHLTGAAGLPVWVLVPAYSEWRWLTEQTDSPWYPSMRLFRQRQLGDWDSVIEEVRGALEAFQVAPATPGRPPYFTDR